MPEDERKRLRQALAAYKQLLEAEPEDLGHLEQLARLSLALGQPARAAGFLVRRAEVLARQGEVEVALADCRSALAVAPGHPEAERLRPTLERLVALPAEPLAVRTPRPEVSDEVRARSTLPISPIKRPIQHLIDELPLDEPIIEASALLAVRDVDEVEVVPLPTDAPAGVRPEDEQATIERPLSQVWHDHDTQREVAALPNRQGPARPPVGRIGRALALTTPARPAAVAASPTAPAEDSLEAELDQVEALIAPTALDAASPPLPQCDLFDPLPAATRDDVAHVAARHRFRPLAVVQESGEVVAELQIIVDGHVRLEHPDGEGEGLLHLGPGDLVGELECVHGGHARFRAVATSPLEVVGLEVLLVDRLRKQFKGFDGVLKREATRRHAAWLLSTNPMFRPLGPTERSLLIAAMRIDRRSPGGLWVEEGQPLDQLALVAGGELEVSRAGQPVAVLRAGHFAGLAAQTHAGVAQASLHAGPRGVLLYVLDGAAQEELRRLPAIRERLEAAAAQRA